MYHTLLVPLDGSQRAEAILPYAKSLAQHYDSHMILLLVVEDSPTQKPSDQDGGEEAQSQLKDHEQRMDIARSYLADLQKPLQEEGIAARLRVCSGDPVEEIIKVAEHERADLIAIASHGRTALAQVVYGSVASAVLERVSFPVLMVRSPAANFQ